MQQEERLVTDLDYPELKQYTEALMFTVGQEIGAIIDRALEYGVIVSVETVMNPLTRHKRSNIEVRLMRELYTILDQKKAEYEANQPRH